MIIKRVAFCMLFSFIGLLSSRAQASHKQNLITNTIESKIAYTIGRNNVPLAKKIGIGVVCMLTYQWIRTRDFLQNTIWMVEEKKNMTREDQTRTAGCYAPYIIREKAQKMHSFSFKKTEETPALWKQCLQSIFFVRQLNKKIITHHHPENTQSET